VRSIAGVFFPTVGGVRNALRILERVDPKFSWLKAENLVDDRIVRKFERDGVVIVAVSVRMIIAIDRKNVTTKVKMRPHRRTHNA
jgi:uncharacterized protein (UPF0254 family)